MNHCGQGWSLGISWSPEKSTMILPGHAPPLWSRSARQSPRLSRDQPSLREGAVARQRAIYFSCISLSPSPPRCLHELCMPSFPSWSMSINQDHQTGCAHPHRGGLQGHVPCLMHWGILPTP